MITRNSIDGNRNTLVGGDLVLQLSVSEQPDILKQFFAAADSRFRSEISESGKIIRISQEINFSSEALFTSLMQLGLPPDVALKIPLEIVETLKEILDDRDPSKLITTSDIRVAIVRVLEGLTNTGRFSIETTSMWAAAYIRRYGNPDNDFIKVVDHGSERELNYEYIGTVVLPHLLSRVIGLPRDSAPDQLFKKIFSNSIIAGMSTEIMRSVNTLNLYSISYRTLLYLVQDLILEPPHPWLVNQATQGKVVEYNCERMLHHYSKIGESRLERNIALSHHAYQEYFRHACAAILAMYGAFLGVGSRYGLLELIRLLKMRRTNAPMWSYCKIRSIDSDLQCMGISTEQLFLEAQRAHSKLSYPAIDGKHLKDLHSTVEFMFPIVPKLRRIAQAQAGEI